MKKLLILSLGAAICLSAGAAAAQNCATPPSCESLGYTKTAKECGQAPTLKCPFDSSAVYCTSCKSLGYSKTKEECIAQKRFMKACPLDPSFVSCDTCMATNVEDKTRFCILAYADGLNDVYNGTYAASKTVLGCLPCQYNFSCSSGLVFDPECNCCNYPK